MTLYKSCYGSESICLEVGCSVTLGPRQRNNNCISTTEIVVRAFAKSVTTIIRARSRMEQLGRTTSHDLECRVYAKTR